jgi:hypothetical protein
LNSKKGADTKRGSVHLDIDTSQCQCGRQKTSSPNQNKKRVSIMLSDEMMLDGYPSLLILGREVDEEGGQNQDQIIKSVLKKSCKEGEMDRNNGDKPMTQERYYSKFNMLFFCTFYMHILFTIYLQGFLPHD